MLCFLDMDGVIVLEGAKLDPILVANLNRLIEHDPRIQIVFNTAWNSYDLDHMQRKFVQSGFQFPDCLIDQTPSSSGGGNPIRRWLLANEKAGTPYVILDDSSHDLEMMWGRLVHCRPTRGFDEQALQKAIDIVDRPIHPEQERRELLFNLAGEIARLKDQTVWLDEAYRTRAIGRMMGLFYQASTLSSLYLMQEAFLTPRTA